MLLRPPASHRLRHLSYQSRAKQSGASFLFISAFCSRSPGPGANPAKPECRAVAQPCDTHDSSRTLVPVRVSAGSDSPRLVPPLACEGAPVVLFQSPEDPSYRGAFGPFPLGLRNALQRARFCERTMLIFRDIAMVLAAALGASLLFWRLRQPLILGYVFAGLILSPLTPGPRIYDLHTFEVLTRFHLRPTRCISVERDDGA